MKGAMAAVLSPEEEQRWLRRELAGAVLYRQFGFHPDIVNKTKATREFIEGANHLRQQWGAGPISWNVAVKFLMARKFDVRRALELYQAHENIRSQEGLLNIDPHVEPLKKELFSGKFSILPSRDSNGAAIAVFSAVLHQPLSISHRTVLQCVVYQLDVALESAETQRNGLVFIYDMTGSKYSNFEYELSQKILTMLKGGYPAKLKKVLIVSAPLWFRAPFNILRMFLRQKLRDRAEVVDEEEDMEVYTTSVAQLESHVAADALPTSLGGRLAANHDAWTRYCIRRSGVARAADDYCDVTAFLDGKFNQLANMDALIDDGGSGGGGEMPSDVSGEMLDAAVTSSEVGGGGATEKHDSEEREKEVAVEKNGGDGGGGGQGAPPDAYESVHRGDGGYTIEDCVEMVRGKSRGGLYREYGLIRAADTDGTFETSRARHNLVKNRYSDVLCYDHSRVRLRNDGNDDDDDASDYINGNYVDGYKQKHAFISTQGPLPKTFPDFWRMIWQERVLVIVMTTRTIERSRLKCGQYWPLDEEMGEQCGDFLIINAGQQHHKDNIFTTLVVHNTKTGESREVMHCQFTCWPDYGVPHSAAVMLDFLFQVRDIQASAVQALGDAWTGHPLGPPILVHCSAGIGRTGTFCTLDIALQQLADVGTIDVESTVRKIRTQRAHSIQMPDQYVFCHLAVIEYALNEGLLDDVDLTGFDDDEDDDD